MSYNYAPDWTEDTTLPSVENLKCPGCGTVAFNAETVMESLLSHTYYAARHVPPSLVATCGNPDCKMCDEDFEIKLRVIVEVKE